MDHQQQQQQFSDEERDKKMEQFKLLQEELGLANKKRKQSSSSSDSDTKPKKRLTGTDAVERTFKSVYRMRDSHRTWIKNRAANSDHHDVDKIIDENTPGSGYVRKRLCEFLMSVESELVKEFPEYLTDVKSLKVKKVKQPKKAKVEEVPSTSSSSTLQ